MLLAQYCACELHEKSLNFFKTQEFDALQLIDYFIFLRLLHITISITID